MPMRKYFIDGITLYKYCKIHNINYNKLLAKATLYQTSPIEALHIHKQKGYTKTLKQYGIDKNHKDFWLYYRRLSDGWDIDKVFNTPRQIGGYRKRLDKSKNK